MIAVIFLVLSVCWILVGFLMVATADDDAGPFGLVIILAALGLNALQIGVHTSDVSLVRNQDIVIQVREEAITRINQDLKDFPQANTLMNADSPIRSMIEAKSQYIKDLTEQKALIAEARMSIEKRKMGAGAWAVWLIGDATPTNTDGE